MSKYHYGRSLFMTGVGNLFIYWLGRHNLGPGWQFQGIYQQRKLPGRISQGHLTRVYVVSTDFLKQHQPSKQKEPTTVSFICIPILYLASYVLTHSIHKIHILVVTIKLVWLVDLNVISFRLVPWMI